MLERPRLGRKRIFQTPLQKYNFNYLAAYAQHPALGYAITAAAAVLHSNIIVQYTKSSSCAHMLCPSQLLRGG